jgi:cytochrome c peroxidase
MKKTVSVGALLLGIILISFTHRVPSAEDIMERHHRGLTDFENQISAFNRKYEKFRTDEESLDEIRKSFARLRLAYKEIEPVYTYLDPEFAKDFINAAPLYKHERGAPRIHIMAPKGLQRMEELVYDDQTEENKKELHQLAGDLLDKFRSSANYQKNVPLTDRMIFEATRDHIIRIFTLNLTGFDTPSGENTLIEAQAALAAAKKLIEPYLQKAPEEIKNDIQTAFQNGEAQFRNEKDFDAFDRMAFLKRTINPLYKAVGDLHYYLQIETKYEVDVLPSALNYRADNLFDEDFLDRYFYGGQFVGENYSLMIDLGEKLFYDPILSANNKISCATCHQPDKAFSDGLPKSEASNGDESLSRNSPSLINAIFSEKYFYDLRADKLANQMEHVVLNHKEFNTDFSEIIEKLESDEDYSRQFANTFTGFDESPVNKHSITASMAAYVTTLTGLNSPFDRYVRDESADLSKEAYDGFNIFMGKGACGTCHFAPVFNGLVPPYYDESESEVLGVATAPGDSGTVTIDPDMGRAASKRLTDESWVYERSFKTVTVRNVALTAPYMHNGAYPDLESVVDFYDRGGGLGHGLDVPNQTLPGDPLNLTDYEKKALIAFMESLTDNTAGEVEY